MPESSSCFFLQKVSLLKHRIWILVISMDCILYYFTHSSEKMRVVTYFKIENIFKYFVRTQNLKDSQGICFFLFRKIWIVVGLFLFGSYSYKMLNTIINMLSSLLPVWLFQHLVGRLIGKQGRYVSFLKQNSGAKIYISTLPYTQEFQICHIEGESGEPCPHIS